ncbi:Tn7-like element transposition protein TnsE [Tepidibacter sp. Z1-5]|uniref:Tn7-like element transposition protein TnsE n=1 Tax=Tepidibacter sp. Z1-5 TaxID=3134138 RepID=UPI0030C4F3A6
MKFEIIEDSLKIPSKGINKKVHTHIFVGYKNGIEYRIPALEIIRAVIATNRFLLNRIVELDSLDKYFIYYYDNSKNLYIDFFDEYERKLLDPEYVRHLAWIITNENVLRMFNQVGKNLWFEGNIKYDFLFKKFNIKARIREGNGTVRILEILEVKNKKIQARNVSISSKYIKEVRQSSKPKLRKYNNLNEIDNKTLDTKIDGAKNTDSEFINTLKTKHTYIDDVKIHKRKKGKRTLRTKEDDNTETYEVENNNLRTTADTGGLDRAKGLEYKNINDVDVKGELEEFIEILKLLEKKWDIECVEVIIRDLPEGKKGKKFSRISDGLTKRRYTVGKMVMKNNSTYNLIEVEREGKSLSMLLLYSLSDIDWERIYSSVTLGLVNKCGSWDSKMLKYLEGRFIYSNRIRHISDKKSFSEKAEFLYSKMKFLK